jgi:hypothetical protein
VIDIARYTAWDPDEGSDIVHWFDGCAMCCWPGVLCAIVTGAADGDIATRNSSTGPPDRERKDLPPLVAESYREARVCAHGGVHIASAVMVRRTLEAVTKSFDPSAKTLNAGLRAMREQGVISDELFRWGDHLRFLGSVGAQPREGESVSERDALDAMQFLEAIIETIYVLRPKFAEMMARRGGVTTS